MQYATTEFVDIAGLVAGASKGEGLGKPVSLNIRETGRIVNVVRCFEDDNVACGRQSRSDFRYCDHRDGTRAGRPHHSRKAQERNVKLLSVRETKMQPSWAIYSYRWRLVWNEGKPARTMKLDPAQRALLKPLCLLTMKPVMYVANVSEKGFTNNPLLTRVEEYAAQEGRRW